MKDYLLDIVQHTHSLGFISLVKITGDDKETTIAASRRLAVLSSKANSTKQCQSLSVHLVCLI